MKLKHDDSFGCLILAAGQSSRFGRVKQLEIINGDTLLGNTVEICLKSKAKQVTVVLGYKAEEISIHLPHRDALQIITNRGWNQGMLSSFLYGVKKNSLVQIPTIVLPTDLLFLSTEVISQLMEFYKTEKSKPDAIFSQYDKSSYGPPTLIAPKLLNLISRLEIDISNTSIKNTIFSLTKKVCFVDFPLGKFDLDTEQDLEHYYKKKEIQKKTSK